MNTYAMCCKSLQTNMWQFNQKVLWPLSQTVRATGCATVMPSASAALTSS